MAIGYNASEVTKSPTTTAELLDPQYKGQVALNGNPTQAAAAFSGVWAAALSNGGSLDDIGPGIDYFMKIKDAGNFNPVGVTPATVQSGETPISLDWDYVNAGLTDTLKQAGIDWQVNVPSDGVFGSFYSQAISKFAPHPAAARLWEEFLYSDEGQNIWLKGLSRPVRLEAMQSAGTADAGRSRRCPRWTTRWSSPPTSSRPRPRRSSRTAGTRRCPADHATPQRRSRRLLDGGAGAAARSPTSARCRSSSTSRSSCCSPSWCSRSRRSGPPIRHLQETWSTDSIVAVTGAPSAGPTWAAWSSR